MDEQDPEILMRGQPRGGEVIEQPAKLIRIAAMIRELLEEVRQSSVDEAGRKRLRQIYDRALAAFGRASRGICNRSSTR